MFGKTILKPGTYTLYTIPNPDTWTVIINSETNVWGAFSYKKDKDVARITVPCMQAAATNHSKVIDTALLRRFQLRLKFELPTPQQLDYYYDTLLKKFPAEFRNVDRVYNISYAEAKDMTHRFIKNAIITNEELKISPN